MPTPAAVTPPTPDPKEIANAGTAIHGENPEALEEWHPKLKADGTLNERAQKESKRAAEQAAKLMESGLQLHEAEEYVLPEILRPPRE